MQVVSQLTSNAQTIADSATSVAKSLGHPRTASTAATRTTGTDTSTGNATASEITANDFLTLLVAEMKNQDPTQPTDPNAYISQMVNVNSLQQLIAINGGIESLNSAAGASANGSTQGSSNSY